jgi:uncharacterized membrane protein YkoI
MNQRTLFLIATALTVFVLVLIGGLATAVSSPSSMTPTGVQVATDPPAALAPTSLDPTVEALIREREAAYQAALADAQARLEQANAQLAQSQALPNGAAASAPAANVTPIDEATAIQIATAYLGGGIVRDVERENERGMLVYEVKFTDGGAIYVDAAGGQVAYARVRGGEEEHDDD